MWSGAHLTRDFTLVIRILWKIIFEASPVLSYRYNGLRMLRLQSYRASRAMCKTS